MRVHMAMTADGGYAAGCALMSWLPLSFGFPAILWGLLALPVIWWLLRLTPPQAADGGLSAAADPGARAEARRRRRTRARGG